MDNDTKAITATLVITTLVLAACLVGTALSGCGDCAGPLAVYCQEGTPCYPVQGITSVTVNGKAFVIGSDIPEEAHRGECLTGTLQCDEYGPSACVDAVTPEAEICDGLDNSCDGSIDERLTLDPFDYRNPCASLCGRCALSGATCSYGQWLCDSGPLEEVCDGYQDEDCDCAVDNIPVEFFYPDDDFPGTVGHGACRPGVRYCSSGGVTIEEDAVIPQEEECNGTDDDCDDQIDEGDIAKPFAFLLVIDNSQSMGTAQETLQDAICNFASDPIANGSLYAIVQVAKGHQPFYVQVTQNFKDAEQTCSTLQDGSFTDEPHGQEMMLKGILLAADLEWPPDLDKRVMVFTDEQIQTANIDPQVERDQVSALCAFLPFHIGAFVPPEHRGDWLPFTVDCYGFVDDLFYDDTTETLTNRLRNAYYGACDDGFDGDP